MTIWHYWANYCLNRPDVTRRPPQHLAYMCAGEGEFGIVHKAMWCGTLVAAKILKTSSSIALGDFRSEIEVLRRVHHPNAVQVPFAP